MHGLSVRDAGSVADLYAPDAAAWLLGCDGCRLTDLDAAGTPAGLRIEDSSDVRIEGARLSGARRTDPTRAPTNDSPTHRAVPA
ncbi:MAG: hypothetical protein U5J97_02950 [Trueperaceae bacterium]|nr:hypothetical protein [Trueperaceae bacterium]